MIRPTLKYIEINRNEIDNLIEQIDKSASWRKKEIIQSYNEKNSNLENKMAICLMYSHWEGFVRDAMREFFKYLNQSSFTYEMLNENFHTCAALNQLQSFKDANPLDVSYIQKFFNGEINLKEKFKCNIDLFCATHSNLNSKNLKTICFKTGIKLTPFELKFNQIDKELLATRNAIVHGEERRINHSNALLLKNLTLEIMSKFQEALLESIQNNDYINKTKYTVI